MSRDYKNVGTAANTTARGGSPMGIGILIGLLLGLCIALGVALYINKGANPFVQKQKPSEPAARESAPAAGQGTPSQAASKPAEGKPEAKPRFDFYKILPGTEEAVTDKEFKRAPAASAKEVYFLQAAAFQNPSDADNLKARLALAGIEAQIQTATLPDGKVWHRVRVGPFSNQDELAKSRAALKENSIEANLIKVREPTP
jgi:cell division protein FtsN